MSSPIGISPVIIQSKLQGDQNGPGLGIGEMNSFNVFRHEYAMPYLLDEIRIGPIDTSLDWKIFHGGISLCGDWVSPFAMCKRLSPEEQQAAVDPNANSGTAQTGVGLLSILQWKLDFPLLVMPDEQITIQVQRQKIEPGSGDNPLSWGLVPYLNPYCLLQGRSLDSSYRPPPQKVVPFITGFRKQFVVTDAQVEVYQTGDGDITNPNREDLKLTRFGLLSTLDSTPDDQFKGIPFPVPTLVTISDSEGAYIAKDPTDALLLTNGGSRIWDVKGSLRANQFWTMRAEVNLAPYAILSGYADARISLLGALTGYRKIDNTQPMQLSRGVFTRSLP